MNFEIDTLKEVCSMAKDMLEDIVERKGAGIHDDKTKTFCDIMQNFVDVIDTNNPCILENSEEFAVRIVEAFLENID